MTRDSQRQKVYDAESYVASTMRIAKRNEVSTIVVAGATLVVPEEILFGTLQAVEDYVRNVEAQAWFKKAWPNHQPVEVRHRRGDTKAHYKTAHHALVIPSNANWAMRESVVLHEMAHAVTPLHGHDADFTGALLHLYRNQFSHEWAFLLGYTFHTQGVEVKDVYQFA